MLEAIFGLIGVVVGSVLSLGREVWMEGKALNQDATYLAIRLIAILDRFVQGCAEVANDDGTWHGQTGQNGLHEPQVNEPELDLTQLDVNWKALPSDLLYEALDLPNLVEEAERRIAYEFEYDLPPDFGDAFRERQFQFATLGLKAANLSKRLRSKYDLPPAEPEGDWDAVTHLERRRTAIQEEIKARREAHAESWKKMMEESHKGDT